MESNVTQTEKTQSFTCSNIQLRGRNPKLAFSDSVKTTYIMLN